MPAMLLLHMSVHGGYKTEHSLDIRCQHCWDNTAVLRGRTPCWEQSRGKQGEDHTELALAAPHSAPSVARGKTIQRGRWPPQNTAPPLAAQQQGSVKDLPLPSTHHHSHVSIQHGMLWLSACSSCCFDHVGSFKCSQHAFIVHHTSPQAPATHPVDLQLPCASSAPLTLTCCNKHAPKARLMPVRPAACTSPPCSQGCSILTRTCKRPPHTAAAPTTHRCCCVHHPASIISSAVQFTGRISEQWERPTQHALARLAHKQLSTGQQIILSTITQHSRQESFTSCTSALTWPCIPLYESRSFTHSQDVSNNPHPICAISS